jgi:hypothetical protein
LTLPQASIIVMNSPGEAGEAWVSVMLDSSPAATVTVNVEIRNSANQLATSDWNGSTRTVAFLQGETYKQEIVYPIDDAIVEWQEDFTFTLADPQGVTLSMMNSAPASLYDNDLAEATFLTQWKLPITDWANVASDEVLWSDEEHRWISSF